MEANSLYFSIILPTYNRAHFLPDAIDSVIRQTYKNWELIIVDDGSTDNTKEVVNKYLQKHSSIEYVYQENRERSAARNKGISMASGAFICFLDSDDAFASNHLQEFYSLIEENNIEPAVYFSGMQLNGIEIPVQYIETKNPMNFPIYNVIGTQRACVAKEVLSRFKFNEKLNIGEDRELWYRIISEYSYKYHSKPTVNIKNHDHRSVLGASCYSNLKTVKGLRQLKLSKVADSKAFKRLFSNSFFNIARYEITNNNRVKAVYFLLAALLADYKNPKRKLIVNIIFRLLVFANINKIKNIIGN